MQIYEDAPGNQLPDFYEQQGMKPQVDWVDLPKPFDCILLQPEGKLDITVAAVYGVKYAARVIESQLQDTQCAAKAYLGKVGNIHQWLAGPVD